MNEGSRPEEGSAQSELRVKFAMKVENVLGKENASLTSRQAHGLFRLVADLLSKEAESISEDKNRAEERLNLRRGAVFIAEVGRLFDRVILNFSHQI
jgi:hypothetical protein